MKIGIGKLGKSILFNDKNWGAIGGDNEAPILFENIIHQNPQHEFILLGVSDYDRLSPNDRKRINKHGNLINPWDNFSKWKKNTYWENDLAKSSDRIKYMVENILPNYKVDKCIFVMGNSASLNVRGKVYKVKEPTELASPLDCHAKYAGPVIHYLNETQTPWLMVLNDPRLYPCSNMKDLFNPPVKVLSQYNESMIHKTHTSYKDHTMIHNNIKGEYASMETIFLIGKEKGKPIDDAPNSLDSFFEDAPVKTNEKNIKFMIVCNEGRPSRYPDLKKYILDHVKDVDIYGKWDERIIGNDNRFKGPKKFNELQAMLPNVKYTFCIPIKKGWCTAKFWEMAHYGIIPFLHPTYDEQDNLKVPDFIRVKDSQDLYNKIKFLEEKPKAYNELRELLNDLLKDEYYDGTFLNNTIMNEMSSLHSS